MAQHTNLLSIWRFHARHRTQCIPPSGYGGNAEAWELAVTTKKTPSVLSLTRQGLRTVRTKHTNKNMVSMGAYVLAEAENKRKVILIATGSEVEIAMDAKAIWKPKVSATALFQCPVWNCSQSKTKHTVASIASRPRTCWCRSRRATRLGSLVDRRTWQTQQSGVCWHDIFGASAPAEELYEKFGITAANVAKTAKDLTVITTSAFVSAN